MMKNSVRVWVEQNEDMDTESEHDITQSEPMECSDSNNALFEAIHNLEIVVHQSGFTIHAVPYD